MYTNRKIVIKQVRRAPRKGIKIKRRMMSSFDVRSLAHQVVKFNKFIPLQKQTLQELLDKTSNYLKSFENKKLNFIKIKRIRLHKDQVKSA